MAEAMGLVLFGMLVGFFLGIAVGRLVEHWGTTND